MFGPGAIFRYQAVNSFDFDEKVKPTVVQQRGRFKVTSEDVHLEKVVAPPTLSKSQSMQVLVPNPMFSLGPSSGASPLTPASVSSTPASVPSNPAGPSTPAAVPSTPAAAPSTHAAISPTPAASNLFHCAANRASEGVCMPAARAAGTEKSLLEEAHDREKELRHEIAELQWRLIYAQEELQKYKTENAEV
ncbi:hypothetical protein F3Y22_tig00000773pilonHSYRG00276 [Hibiscus syriacus]|uniref:Uncharacterized protein n=1 Tax=Hibiscus syriacus TaxID=106335 RepID=A0A6A3CXP8_HIBSY|nr:hypothetical protein F3Y22_tig00000773pilonHSYRG00276 [Hibiscus syriacus]